MTARSEKKTAEEATDMTAGMAVDMAADKAADKAAVTSRLARAPVRYGIVVIVVVLDQITKVAIERSLALYDRLPITSFFNITKAYNEGAAFSFLNDAGGWQRWFFTIVSSVVSLMLIVWLTRLTPRERWLGISLALILGGALGNLIDRIIYGHVVDFIQIYWRGWWTFPSFNVADAAITCGATILIFLTLFEKPEESAAARQ